MKQKKFVLSIAMLLVLVISAVLATGCEPRLDNEKTPLILATQELDGVFSPFFATSAYDSQVVGMTQLSMLDVDKKANIDYGDNNPTVVRYINETKVDERTPQQKENENGRYEDRYYTTYQFVLKNGILFSDGKPLTYKDVLFNLYLYLDPVYNGSSTLYSTDIIGLSAYRTQKDDGSAGSFEEHIQSKAQVRVGNFLKYYSSPKIPGWEETPEATIKDDLAELKRAFKQDELNSDWAVFAGGLDDYKKEYTSVTNKELVTEVWQAYLVNWGICEIVYDTTGNDPTKYKDILYGNHTQAIAKIKSDNKKNKNADIDALIKEYCINQVYAKYFGAVADANESVFIANARDFVAYTATGANYFTYVSNLIKSEDLQASKRFSNISGIKVKQLAVGDTFIDNQKVGADDKKITQEITLDEESWVLEVKIYGVDPKAINNFGFSVAPMHYYSNPDAIGRVENPNAAGSGTQYFTTEKDGYQAFSVGVDGVEDHFGFPYANATYMNRIIKGVIGLPMGAGTYKATNRRGDEDIKDVSALGANVGFFESNIVYYTRNTYFHTVSKAADIGNAKIKLLRLQVTNSTKLFEAVQTGTVHYADPAAKTATVDALNDVKNKDLKFVTTRTNGYGYIGINAKYVPNLLIRRAIMLAMDTEKVLDYYPGGMVEQIFWPMSKESWAYPDITVSEEVPYYNRFYNIPGKDFNKKLAVEKITELRIEAGYTTQTSKNGKTFYQKSSTDRLDYTFSVAGGSTDHPAYLTLRDAVDLLNKECGFNVKLVTDPFALRKLSSGLLTVWAAAWGSGIDPDMYQVYHKDSMATSIKSWGYPSILGIGGEEAKGSLEEQKIITDLSDKIDAARKLTERTDRIPIYGEALDLIMKLAVELPTYQRSNLYVYKSSVIDPDSVLSQDECSPYRSPLTYLWNVSFVESK